MHGGPCFPSLSRAARAGRRGRGRDPGRRRAGGGRGGRRARLRRRRGLRRRLRRDRRRARAAARPSCARPRARRHATCRSAARTATGSSPCTSGRRCGATRCGRSSPGAWRWSPRAATSRSTRSPPGAACGCHTVVSSGNPAALDPADVARAAGARGGRRLDRAVPGVRRRRRAAGRGAGRVRRARHRRRGAEGGRVRGRRRGRRRAHRRGGRATSASSARWSRRPARAWADDVHELLELAQGAGRARAPPAQRRPAASPCSPAPAATRRSPPTSARGSGCALPALGAGDRRRGCATCCPTPATVGNPLDYTALIWGEVETLRDIVATVGADPAIDQLLVLYDQPVGIDGASEESGPRCARASTRGAAASAGAGDGRLHAARAARRRRGRALHRAGVPAVAGLRTGLACAAALRLPGRRPRPGCARSRRRPRRVASRRGQRPATGSPSTRPRSCCATPASRCRTGRLVRGEDDAAAALEELGGPRRAQADRSRAARTRAMRARWRSGCTTRTSSARPTGAWRRWRDRRRRGAGRAHGGARASSCSWPRARRRRARARGRRSAASGPSCSTTSPWCRCRPRPSAWSGRSAPCARAALLTGGRGRHAARRGRRGATGRGGRRAAAGRAGLELIELNPVLVHERGARGGRPRRLIRGPVLARSPIGLRSSPAGCAPALGDPLLPPRRRSPRECLAPVASMGCTRRHALSGTRYAKATCVTKGPRVAGPALADR